MCMRTMSSIPSGILLTNINSANSQPFFISSIVLISPESWNDEKFIIWPYWTFSVAEYLDQADLADIFSGDGCWVLAFEWRESFGGKIGTTCWQKRKSGLWEESGKHEDHVDIAPQCPWCWRELDGFWGFVGTDCAGVGDRGK